MLAAHQNDFREMTWPFENCDMRIVNCARQKTRNNEQTFAKERPKPKYNTTSTNIVKVEYHRRTTGELQMLVVASEEREM
ncbi:unnamed protein product, partial [Ceratitis capitata]